MKKKFLIGMLLPLAAMAAGLTACNKGTPVSEDTTFTFEVRRFNGQGEDFSPLIDGELLASKVIDVKEGQITVADALTTYAPAVEGAHKLFLNDTDYLVFTETTMGYLTSWFLTDGYFSKEPNYYSGDFEWSYMAYNGHYSNGVTIDFLDGLTTYTVVVDGYDGNIGTSPTF